MVQLRAECDLKPKPNIEVQWSYSQLWTSSKNTTNYLSVCSGAAKEGYYRSLHLRKKVRNGSLKTVAFIVFSDLKSVSGFNLISSTSKRLICQRSQNHCFLFSSSCFHRTGRTVFSVSLSVVSYSFTSPRHSRLVFACPSFPTHRSSFLWSAAVRLGRGQAPSCHEDRCMT